MRFLILLTIFIGILGSFSNAVFSKKNKNKQAFVEDDFNRLETFEGFLAEAALYINQVNTGGSSKSLNRVKSFNDKFKTNYKTLYDGADRNEIVSWASYYFKPLFNQLVQGEPVEVPLPNEAWKNHFPTVMENFLIGEMETEDFKKYLDKDEAIQHVLRRDLDQLKEQLQNSNKVNGMDEFFVQLLQKHFKPVIQYSGRRQLAADNINYDKFMMYSEVQNAFRGAYTADDLFQLLRPEH